MTETTHHYPQIIRDGVDILERLKFPTFESFYTTFTSLYTIDCDTLDPTKVRNSLRLSWFDSNDFQNGLDYTTT